jgi:hypothetical protein
LFAELAWHLRRRSLPTFFGLQEFAFEITVTAAHSGVAEKKKKKANDNNPSGNIPSHVFDISADHLICQINFRIVEVLKTIDLRHWTSSVTFALATGGYRLDGSSGVRLALFEASRTWPDA